MKYIVILAGRELEVEVDGDQVTVGGTRYAATMSSAPGTPVRQLLLDGRAESLAVDGSGSGRWAITSGGERWETEVLDERARHIRSLTGASSQGRGPAALKAPMPGLVVRVQVEAGATVSVGSGVVVLEAMKMENELRAASAATVRTVRVKPGEAVEKGQVLVEFE
ncbi:MAG TPA: biotin/lipoyl-containing protein [Gemmatimonadales bacterium]|jgi:pyruvate carboxylase subunit B|nr:biotin/lipoyl-containing protein [Gemmatimonadales bacterium]